MEHTESISSFFFGFSSNDIGPDGLLICLQILNISGRSLDVKTKPKGNANGFYC